MQIMRAAALLYVCALIPLSVGAQQAAPTPAPSAERDPQALAILQQSLEAMGGIQPSDSVATGTVTPVAGGQTNQGTIRILTKGTAESLVQFTMPNSVETTIYANGEASQTVNSTQIPFPLEPTVTSQAAEFPLPLILALINNPDTSFQYVGIETLSGESLYHIKTWDSFASLPAFQNLSSFSARDVWIDSNTSLPQRISYTRYPAQGDGGTMTDVFFTNYLKSSGILYPSAISESLNGTPWATITVQSVAFDTGLSDSNFPVQAQ